MAWLDLVALGTVCDVVPLTGLNRAFVLRGDRRHAPPAKYRPRGAVESGPAGWTCSPPGILGFLLGPRINAGGRIGDAALGARLLTCEGRPRS